MDHNERIIADFLKTPEEGGAYTDEKLAALLAHAEDGKLSFFSCCCLVGIPSAEHALKGFTPTFVWHAKDTEQSRLAEQAFLELGIWNAGGDETRRAKLIPLIKAEMSRRESLGAAVVSEVIAL